MTTRIFVLLCLICSFALEIISCAHTPKETAPQAKSLSEVKASDGLVIQYQVHGSGDTALVFVHGWSCNRQYWKHQIPHFGKKYTVVVLDLGGHGESGRNRSAWSISSFGDDVRAVVETLDLKKTVLIGHSMGGPVIVEAARKMPARVVALVPVDTMMDVALKPSEEHIVDWLGAYKADFAKATREFGNRLFVESTDPALRQSVTEEMASAPPGIGIAAMESMFRYDQAAGVADINVPVRGINADLFPTNVESNRRHIKDYQVVIMKGLGHFPQLENPEEFNRTLEKVLGGLGL